MKYIVFSFLLILSVMQPVMAQDTPRPENFTSKAIPKDAETLITSSYTVKLWGVEAAHVSGTSLSLRGRTEMDELVGDEPVRCDVISWRSRQPIARCFNQRNVDLGAEMLRQGFAVVQRQDVIGTTFEKSYPDLEQVAKNAQLGVWDMGSATQTPLPPVIVKDENQMMTLLLSLIGLSFICLILLTYLILRGFSQVEKLVKKSMALTRAQEDRMRKREKFVVAAMLEGELMANRGKVEAFLVINRDVMAGLNAAKKNNKLHKYQESTEIIQRNPILSRSVFDGNTDKLELLGPQIAKDVVSLYNDISSEADYLTLEKDMPIDEAINQAQVIILSAEKLLDPVDKVLNSLEIILSDRKRAALSQFDDSEMMEID